MQLKSLLSVALFSTAFAAPSELEKRGIWASCSVRGWQIPHGQGVFEVSASLIGWDNNSSNCGGNFKWNAGQQCGQMNDWSCSVDRNGIAHAKFKIYNHVNNNCVENAIWLSSNPHIEGVHCSWP